MSSSDHDPIRVGLGSIDEGVSMKWEIAGVVGALIALIFGIVFVVIGLVN